MKRTLTKLGIALLLLVVLGWLFLRSVQDVRSTPYEVRAVDLQAWELVADEGAVFVGLRPSSAFTADLFKQIFARNMESITAPARPVVPILLQQEAQALGALEADQAIAAARAAGLELATLVPRCLATRRLDPPASYDYYYVIFEASPFEAVRRALQGAIGTVRSGFEPAGFQPTLVVATSDPAARNMLPFSPDAARDCVAPIAIG